MADTEFNGAAKRDAETMPRESSEVPPRLSDLHGAERVLALRARAAADRDRFIERRDARLRGTGMLAKWIAKLAG